MKSTVLGICGALLLAASPGGADWLVTQSGARVETRGAWQVKGKLVVFTRADGTLASLRLTEVDLEKSREATSRAKAEAEKPSTPPPPAPRKKLAVLTDKDFPSSAAADSPQERSPAAAEAPADVASPPPLSVKSWKRIDRPGGEGVEIQGTLANNVDTLVVSVSVEVELYDEQGKRVASTPAVLPATSLRARSSAEFAATFPATFFFSEAKFVVRGVPLDRVGQPDPPPPDAPQL